MFFLPCQDVAYRLRTSRLGYHWTTRTWKRIPGEGVKASRRHRGEGGRVSIAQAPSTSLPRLAPPAALPNHYTNVRSSITDFREVQRRHNGVFAALHVRLPSSPSSEGSSLWAIKSYKYADSATNRSRNVALFSVFSLGGGFLMVRSRALAERQRQRALDDYSVSVDRSGSSSGLAAHAQASRGDTLKRRYGIADYVSGGGI